MLSITVITVFVTKFCVQVQIFYNDLMHSYVVMYIIRQDRILVNNSV